MGNLNVFKEWLIRHTNEIIIAVCAILLPVKPLMVAIGFLIFFDLITGVYKAYKASEEITSKKLAKTVTKVIFYNIAILSSMAIESITGNEFIPVIKIVASGIASIEGFSIFENISSITGKNFRQIILDVFKHNP